MPKNSWYSIENKQDTAEIFIHDEIGMFGVTAKDFMGELKGLKAKNIVLNIHTPGGSVFDGFAMYNAIKDHPASVHAVVNGYAASIGSVIMLAADTIEMPENSYVMIHRVSGGVFGTAEAMRKQAELMERLEGTIENIYEGRAKKKGEYDWKNLMENETWFSAKEALDMGWVDNITEELKAVAKFESDALPEDHPLKEAFNVSEEEIAEAKEREEKIRKIGAFLKLQEIEALLDGQNKGGTNA